MSFFAEGAESNSVSSAYRLELDSLVSFMNPLGLADGYYEPVPGEYYFHGYASIDSTFIFVGVSFGWIAAMILLAGAVLVCGRIVVRRASVPDLAIASVLPALFTVAPITQFGSYLWFVIGIGGAALAGSRMKGAGPGREQNARFEFSSNERARYGRHLP
ncbi:hypothetical protein [Gordonia sp. p3-SID1431]|uniref:hypothetical protein n=1 Tax=Gordonia sp. p3-SID1431 TaxID=2916159 RepID=UPI0021A83EB6|nr:hypothetical protein [Gordonia sp. p3-SID1431]MCT1353179.1 hypothetical protein [Gordonia sp. p3-SID1431]